MAELLHSYYMGCVDFCTVLRILKVRPSSTLPLYYCTIVYTKIQQNSYFSTNYSNFDWCAVFVLIKTFVKISLYHCTIAQRYNGRKLDGFSLNQMPKKAKP